MSRKESSGDFNPDRSQVKHQNQRISTQEDQANPWLNQNAGKAPIHLQAKKINRVTIGKDSSAQDKAAYAIKRDIRKTADARTAELQDAQVALDPSNFLRVGDPSSEPGSRRKANGQQEITSREDADSEDDSLSVQGESDDEKGTLGLTQREMIAKAFAGDNVIKVCHPAPDDLYH